MTFHVCHRITFPKNVISIQECPINSSLIAFQSNSNVVYLLNSKTMKEIAWIDSHKSSIVSSCWENDNIFISFEDGVLLHYIMTAKNSEIFTFMKTPVHNLCFYKNKLYGVIPSPTKSSIIQINSISKQPPIFTTKEMITSMVISNDCIVISLRKSLITLNLQGKVLNKYSFDKNPLTLIAQCCSFKRKYVHPYSHIKETNIVSAFSTSGDVYFIEVINHSQLRFMKKCTLSNQFIQSIAIDPYSSSWDRLNFCVAFGNKCLSCSTSTFDTEEVITTENPPIISLLFTTKSRLYISSHSGEVIVGEWVEN
ncbi:hypothetical protein ENU1_100000 [Entamoeba nuttalli P19]|uniref:WD domain, G-beta repeat-containing protein n=1 Tax=Entamoeba nuttalli (strain P19) TaxID=1076696 RepID=K2H1Q1_ENTNP|nr:hypothetical protein ENU1_100000 [Entamoeba nuttalli P19]EKE40162.1 hypothetical protein ENU1_100000 [Entamoeba nuttalli P19]|eukprot:XP_008857504.1 hypothetical protein ENU1_100000 [Entamoeba nuttalli P19]